MVHSEPFHLLGAPLEPGVVGFPAIVALWFWLRSFHFQHLDAFFYHVRACTNRVLFFLPAAGFGNMAELLAPETLCWFVHERAYLVNPKHSKVEALRHSCVLEYDLYTSCGDLLSLFLAEAAPRTVYLRVIHDGLHVVMHGVLN